MKKILVILLILISNLSDGQKPNYIVIRKQVNAVLLEKLMLEEINIYRKSKRLQPLMPDSNLFKQSRKHSEWMDENKKLQHGQPIDECCFIAGYSYGQSYAFNAKGLIRVWIESPGHNAALLHETNNIGGIGIKIESNSHNGIYATFRMSHKPTKEDLERITSF